MQGDAKFEDSLRLRMSLMQPSTYQVQRFLDAHPPQLSPGKCCLANINTDCNQSRRILAMFVKHAIAAGVSDLILTLQKRGTLLFLVSGGFRAIIHPIAKSLGVPIEHVYANTILFKV